MKGENNMFGFLPFGNNAPVNNTNSPNYYQQLPSNLRDFKPQEEEALLNSHVQKIIRKDNEVREQLLCEIFRLEKLNPERAKLVDPETKLFNRRYFDKRLAEEIQRAERYSLDMTVLLIEMDRGRHSPAAHYDMVIGLAGLLRSNIRAADPLARFDTHRFAVLLPETPQEAGSKAARKVVEIVRGERLRDHEGKPVALTVSVAAVAIHAGEFTPDEVVSKLKETLERISQHGGDAHMGWQR